MVGLWTFAASGRSGRGLGIRAAGLALVAAWCVSSPTAVASRSGPLAAKDGSTGAGGASCRQCHGNDVGAGSVQINGFPAFYQLNAVYNLSVVISDPTKFGAGFQASVQTAGGAPAGTIIVTDAVNTQLNETVPPDWKGINHSETGVDNSVSGWAGSATYSFQWQAPASDVGSVTAWAAGNAIDDNGFASGDIIYLTSVSAGLGDNDECTTAPVITVPIGSPGSPITTTINGDNTTATGPDVDCLPSQPAGDDIGWWQPFEILEYADVIIDHCGTEPTQRPNWGFLRTGCGCGAGQYNVNSADRTTCGDFNVTLRFLGLPPGIYYYPVYTVPGDKRCENFANPPCSDSSECGGSFTCQDNLHPYVMHITTEAPIGGCCHPHSATCDDDVPHDSCTAPDDRWVAGRPCSEINCIEFNEGPDLIVGNVWDCQQLGRVGTPGSGTIGMSCWTTACTIGDEGTDWYGLPDVNHPMISVNLFRLNNPPEAGGGDRLMQLGQSWLKHGFGTENADDCGFGCTPGHFNLNGPGCSDTYAAVQFWPCDLGPRSMINPYTGEMPESGDLGASSDCIPAGRETQSYLANDHRGHDHDGISHRLQVRDVDLDPGLNAGATYYSEGQYLLPHEYLAANGTQNNNVSHKQIDVSCGGTCGLDPFIFTDLSDTFAEQPAINAWPGASQSLIEPAPMVDGRGILAYEATDLGGGEWHYEYALYNMNMDRGMGSLSIPVAPGVTVSNIGFYAPLNHAPEPNTVNYTNTPWSVSTSGGAVTWSTDDVGTDPFANAVRFGTMYNFWFDADQPPESTDAMVGLFKTGGTVAVSAIGPSTAAPTPGNIVWDPATNPGPWPNENPEAATRALRFRVNASATATGTFGQDAIKITMIDLQHPDPRNLPQFPPRNFSTFDTGTHGTCAGGDFAGHHCDDNADCLRATPGGVDGTCALPGPGCTAAGEMNGCARWVGRPWTFYETQGPPLSGPYRAARLQCTPFYWDWKSEEFGGRVTVIGAEILPSSEYSVQTYASSCKGVETGCSNVSAAVTMYTRRYGDVDAPYNPGSTPLTNQPNAIDVAQMVNKFKNAPGSPDHYRAQNRLNALNLNQSINAIDIVAVVDATKSFAFAFFGPCPCPSTVTCGTICNAEVCVSFEGSCVKTCVGGDNAGEPCINNNHCPGGGTCGICVGGSRAGLACGVPVNCPGGTCGECRDMCGRCE